MNEQKKFRDATVEMIMLCAAAFAEKPAQSTQHTQTHNRRLCNTNTQLVICGSGGKEGDSKLQGQMIIRDDPVGIWPRPLATAWCSGW